MMRPHQYDKIRLIGEDEGNPLAILGMFLCALSGFGVGWLICHVVEHW